MYGFTSFYIYYSITNGVAYLVIPHMLKLFREMYLAFYMFHTQYIIIKALL